MMDAVIVCGYLIICVFVGIFRLPHIRSLYEYTTGVGKFSTLALSLSMMTASISAADIFSSVEQGFSIGGVFIAISIIHFIGWQIMETLVAHAIPTLKIHGCITLVDVMYFFGKLGRTTCLILIFYDIFLLRIYYSAAASIFEKCLQINFKYAATTITIIVALYTLYSIFGGIHAIIVTNILQFLIFFVCFPMICLVSFMEIDIALLFQKIPFEKTHFTTENLQDFFTMSIFFTAPPMALCYVQKLLICKRPSQVRIVCQVTGVFTCIFMLAISTIELMVCGLKPDIKSDEVFFYFINYTVSPAVMSLVTISFLAIIMSTASSFLNAINVVIMRDIIYPLFPIIQEKKSELIVTKIAGCTIAILAYKTIFIEKDFLKTIQMLSNIYDPFIIIPLILALTRCRIKSQNYKYVMLTTLSTLIIAYYLNGEFDAITYTVCIAVSLTTTLLLKDHTIAKFVHAIDFSNRIEDSTDIKII